MEFEYCLLVYVRAPQALLKEVKEAAGTQAANPRLRSSRSRKLPVTVTGPDGAGDVRVF
ncbi:hypothetical protein GCM10011577_08690 [Pseudarthrobacter polychromogenes]|uniref:Uncharacterized protein n=1 Tax=Pseudarthrobacter polychromogenes TaxID=1676 RepID=A0ABQ1XBJ5_9MICC|nr:hypothetical protein GCM10011577_08690 [Pseudarthrobacter polychromogenes]